MRVLFTGSRHWKDGAMIDEYIANVFQKTGPFTVIHGGCRRGVDRFVDSTANILDLPTEVYRADWRLGPKSGPIRNQQMVDTKPDTCVAFWDGYSLGTKDCLKRVILANIPYSVIFPKLMLYEERQLCLKSLPDELRWWR